MVQDTWRIWSSGERSRRYGEMLYQRAVGDLPEMESSKAAAKKVAALLRPGDKVLDVGCGAGHYLTSLRKAVSESFSYTGVDATESYIELAKRAFPADSAVSFEVGDVYSLPFRDQAFDIVMCNNLLLHLPNLKPALSELYRVTARNVVIRTLIGNTTYRIQEARSNKINDDGTLSEAHFLNIYSVETVKKMMEELAIPSFEIEEDKGFDCAKINAERELYPEDGVKTKVINGLQVGGYVIQPWAFLTLSCSPGTTRRR
ncbi:class I SAM-dependent methyltransferase [Pelagibius sp.]|uniref:class I SAM-dependent methyltransferase n=1 Tax=Pelagibius sp. TaxID=1931238 RepID=UPI003B503E6E